MNISYKRISYLLLVLCFLTGCTRDSIYKGKEGSGLTKGDVFDYSTTQKVQLNIDYQLPRGFRVKFAAYTENPVYVDEYKNYMLKEEVKSFLEGYTKEDGSLDIQAELPLYASEVYIYSTMVGVPLLLKGEIENGRVKPIEVSPVLKSKTLLTKATTPYYTNWKERNLTWDSFGTWDISGKPAFLLPEGIEMNQGTLDIINATIPAGEKLDARFCTHSEIALSESAHVKLYFVSNSSERKNALAYYIFTGDQPDEKWINEHLIMLYPNLTEEALKPGDGILLRYYNEQSKTFEDQFPANVKIGFVLLVDAWEGNGKIANKTHVMYSYKYLNSYRITDQIMADRPQMALFKAEDRVILSFEDQPWTERLNSLYQGDFRDNVFVLDVDPIRALPPDIPDGESPDTPSGNVVGFWSNSGILAFEDMWPKKGDYDMNDVVVRYDSKTYANSDWMITGVVDTFEFLNNGADFANGFGYQMGIDRANVEKIEIISDYYCEGQGLDPTLDKATIMLFDNVQHVPAGTIFTVKIWLKEPSSTLYGYQFAPYNPFITVNHFLEQGRSEVHLVNAEPTPKMNRDLFNTDDDLSNPDQGVYYVSNAKYPFAFNLGGLQHYVIPTEANNITKFYPDFDNWVESGGKKSSDWYLRPNENQ